MQFGLRCQRFTWNTEEFAHKNTTWYLAIHSEVSYIYIPRHHNLCDLFNADSKHTTIWLPMRGPDLDLQHNAVCFGRDQTDGSDIVQCASPDDRLREELQDRIHRSKTAATFVLDCICWQLCVNCTTHACLKCVWNFFSPWKTKSAPVLMDVSIFWSWVTDLELLKKQKKKKIGRHKDECVSKKTPQKTDLSFGESILECKT